MSDIQIVEGSLTNGISVVRGAGELDFHTAPLLERAITSRLEAGGRHLVVDLGEVTFIDSTAIGVLMTALGRVRDVGGSLAVVNDRDNVRSIFEMMGLDEEMPLRPSVEDAVSAVAPAA